MKTNFILKDPYTLEWEIEEREIKKIKCDERLEGYYREALQPSIEMEVYENALEVVRAWLSKLARFTEDEKNIIKSNCYYVLDRMKVTEISKILYDFETIDEIYQYTDTQRNISPTEATIQFISNDMMKNPEAYKIEGNIIV